MTSSWPVPALVYSVAELTRLIKGRLESDPRLMGVWVRGEIGSFKHHSSGHMYFTLKDDASSIHCVMFRSFCQRLRFRPESGLGVLAFGEVGVYEQSGAYQFYVRELQPDGLGALYLALEQTRERLAREGLFRPERKRPLPRLPRRIGLVTSPVGAALQDIIAVARRRFPGIELVLAPVTVQGTDAPRQIVRALELLGREPDVDLIILARGGGSKEDLWTFNDEQVARATAASPVPVVSAVGHEVDYTLTDLAADVRAPTPSVAAELVVPDRRQLERELMSLYLRLKEVVKERLVRSRERLGRQESARPWRTPASLLAGRHLALAYAEDGLKRACSQYVRAKQSELSRLERTLAALSPLAVLKRGFAVVLNENTGALVTQTRQVQPGERLVVKLSDGDLHVRVESRGEGR